MQQETYERIGLVSIIIPCYKQGVYLAESVESALNQTYKNIEIVIINDCSPDNTHEIALSFANKYDNIIYINNSENIGCCAAKNKAIRESHGEYILPLDADDIIEKEYVEKAINILQDNSEIGIVTSSWSDFGKRNKKYCDEYKAELEIFENQIPNSSLFRRDAFEEVGGYHQYCFYGLEDWDLWLSIIERGYKVVKMKEILFKYRRYELPSRTDEALLNIDEINSNIVKNHAELYINSQECISRIFTDGKLHYRKYKRLQRMINKLWPVCIVELMIIVYLTIR